MDPARALKRLDCDAPLAEAARVVLTARLDLLEQTRAAITGPEDVQTLHALRIAAKQLRYSLEVFGVCFAGNVAQERADAVRALQDILGRIHDLDVLHDLFMNQLRGIDDRAREAVLALALAPTEGGRRDAELQGALSADGRSDGRLGLYKTVAAKADERRGLYERFVALWAEWEAAGFLSTLRASLESAGGSAAGSAPL